MHFAFHCGECMCNVHAYIYMYMYVFTSGEDSINSTLNSSDDGIRPRCLPCIVLYL